MQEDFPIAAALEKIAIVVSQYDPPILALIAVQEKSPYKILVATILSARTKDATTAKAAAKLFTRAATLDALGMLDEKEIASLIYPVGFYKVKARHLKALPRIIAQQCKGEIPSSTDQLVTLPGVGRKTANLVASLAFDKEEICVDTHVHRIMNIWGYVETKTPFATELALREKLPLPYWRRVNALLVAFGQSICFPVFPRCNQCVLESICPRVGVGSRPRKTKEKVG